MVDEQSSDCSEMPKSGVVQVLSKDYGENFHTDLLEQYKIVRNKVADVINDRNTQNKFLFTMMAALLAVPVVFLRLGPAEITIPQSISFGVISAPASKPATSAAKWTFSFLMSKVMCVSGS